MISEYYTNYKSFISDLTNKEKILRKDIESFKIALGNNSNTISIHIKLEKDLKSFKELVDQLQDAYNSTNVPYSIPEMIIDKRQKEINTFLASFKSMNDEFTKLIDDKYLFKGMIEEDYKDKEEYKNKDAKELTKLAKDKMKKQDEILDQILNITKETNNNMQNVNAKIQKDKEPKKDTNKQTDKEESKIKKFTQKIKNFFKK